MSFWRTLRFITAHPLNRGKPAQALLRFVAWQIRSRVLRRELIHTWVNGSRFYVRSGETGLTQNIYCGLHEFEDMSYVLHVLDSQDLFVDVGANSGSYTILACAARGARGICFEPVSSTFQRLVRNIELNNLAGRVTARNCGVGDVEDELVFTSGLDTTNHVIVPGEPGHDQVTVKVYPLDTLLHAEAPSLIKIDVEGQETRVIGGMQEIMRQPSLHSIIIELNGNGRRYGFRDEDLVALIQDFGFHPYEYEPFARLLRPLVPGSWKPGNVLFLRNEAWIEERLKSAPRYQLGAMKV